MTDGSWGLSQLCVCHQADPQAENKPNPTHGPPRWLVPSQGGLFPPRVACPLPGRWHCTLPAHLLPSRGTLPSSLATPTLRGIQGPRRALQPSLASSQHLWCPAGLESSVITRRTWILEFTDGITHWPRQWLTYFSPPPNNLICHSTE